VRGYRELLLAASVAPRVDYRGLTALPSLLQAEHRQRVFVICGPSGRHVARLETELVDFELEIFAQARRHVPRDLVEQATGALKAFAGDTVVSLGGGSATGLGKALRLEHSFFFIAVPTTYAGSELTSLYGITSASSKQTGRDPRVVPDVALYDVELTRDMPLGLSVTSLLNALAHPLSAVSTAQLGQEQLERALEAAQKICGALLGLVRDPASVVARSAALEGAVLAGRVLADSPVGLHHKLAHTLGGSFDLDHAALHSVLLPHSVSWMRQQSPESYASVQASIGDEHLPATLFDHLSHVGAATGLAALGLRADAFQNFLRTRPELPRGLLEAAYAGRRP
jgi:maleylacetate reductase